MIQAFKILHRIDDVDPETWFVRINECQQTTRSAVGVSNEGEIIQRMNLMKPNSRGDVRKNFFSCRVVDQWNSLPSSVQEAEDVRDFKEKYDDFMAGDLM